jgi:hypothetical protein
MLYLERSIDPNKFKGNETVIKFRFTDLRERPDGRLVMKSENSEDFLMGSGKDTDVYFSCAAQTLSDIWMGDRS